MSEKTQKKKKTVLIASIFFLVAFAAKPAFIWTRNIYLSPDVHDAIKNGDAVQVRDLMRRGANPNQYGMGGLVGGTPLDFAMEKPDVEMINLLIDEGADVNSHADGYTPLMHAPTPEVAKLLLDRGADPRILSKEGYTAWQLAKFSGSDDVAKVIMKYENRMKKSSSAIK